MNLVLQSSPSVRDISSHYPPKHWSPWQSQKQANRIGVLRNQACILVFPHDTKSIRFKKKKKSANIGSTVTHLNKV